MRFSIEMPTTGGAGEVNYLIGVIEASISDLDVRERCFDAIREIAEYAVRRKCLTVDEMRKQMGLKEEAVESV